MSSCTPTLEDLGLENHCYICVSVVHQEWPYVQPEDKVTLLLILLKQKKEVCKYHGWWVELKCFVEHMKAARLEQVLIQVVTVPYCCYDNHLGTHTPHLLQ